MYYIILIIAFLAAWIWAAINPIYPHDWLLENYLVFAFVPVMIWSWYKFRLSKISYTCIVLFMILHIIGSHYTYAEVPFGSYVTNFANNIWWAVANLFGGDRNSYDRLVHFGFGLFFAYPVREIFIRIAKVKWFWGYFLPIAIMWMFWAMYEIIERIAAINVDAAAWSAFLGSQWDIRDAQKDMILAGIWWFVTMCIVAIVNSIYQKDFNYDMYHSFDLDKNDKPLWEVKLAEIA